MITDGCTAGPLSDFFNSFAYDCCVIHDNAYRTGVDIAEKLSADANLWLCVAQHGHPVWATVMLIAVTTFGWFWWNRRPN